MIFKFISQEREGSFENECLSKPWYLGLDEPYYLFSILSDLNPIPASSLRSFLQIIKKHQFSCTNG